MGTEAEQGRKWFQCLYRRKFYRTTPLHESNQSPDFIGLTPKDKLIFQPLSLWSILTTVHCSNTNCSIVSLFHKLTTRSNKKWYLRFVFVLLFQLPRITTVGNGILANSSTARMAVMRLMVPACSHFYGLEAPYDIFDWYGGRHTCHTASGATGMTSCSTVYV